MPGCRFHGRTLLCEGCGVCLKCQDNRTSYRDGPDLVYACEHCGEDFDRVEDIDSKRLDIDLSGRD